MLPLKLLELASRALESYDSCYAVAGGLAASLYRISPRLTKDVDIAIAVGGKENTVTVAQQILSDLGLPSALGWIAGGEGKIDGSIALVIGKAGVDEYDASIDFLLPSLPWVEQGIVRAQENKIDFGFAKLATLTPEDLIVAKVFALAVEPNRFQDLDDLQSIFRAENNLEVDYIASQFARLSLSLPKELYSVAPKLLCESAKK